MFIRRTALSRALPLALLSVASAPAYAGWPDDVSLSAMSTYQGAPVDNLKATSEAYEQVVRELGVAIANKPIAPAETLGAHGFDLSLTSTVAFLSTTSDDADSPAAWERVHADNDPTGAMFIPTLNFRKGLPLSLEAGASWGYVAFSRQTVFGAYGRWALVEGYRQYPDLTIQAGYRGYLGNDELKLGVMDARLSLGYSIPFGVWPGINDAVFSPQVGAGLLRIKAEPVLSETEQASLGVGAVSGFKGSDSYTDGYAPADIHLGFRIVSGDFEVIALGTVAPSVIPTVNLGFGYEF